MSGIDWPAYGVQRWDISRLVPYPHNARAHPPTQIAHLRASLNQFGWTMPILARSDGTVIAGHARLAAALAEGLREVPVMVANGWSEAQCRAYTLADNKLAEGGSWNDDALIAELLAIKNDIAIPGFDDTELLRLLAAEPMGVLADVAAENVPQIPEHPQTKLGDIWQLGDHQLICGDCRDARTFREVCDGRSINVAFTSPPYAEQREYDKASEFRPIRPDDYVQWFEPAAANVKHHLTADGSWFVNIKPSSDGLDTELYVMDLVLAHVRQWGWHFATEFCWERNGVPKSVTQRFKNQFEPIYQFALGRWKMRPDTVRHFSENVPRAGGEGVGETSWRNTQGNGGAFAARKRLHGGRGGWGGKDKQEAQGTNWDCGEYIGPGLAYPGNRLPTFASDHTATGHTAAFPVGLPEFFFKAFSDEHDIVCDPFAGSGSSLIAAERCSRRCLAIELSPAYCDVIIQRWQEFARGTARLLSTGQSFAEVTQARSVDAYDGNDDFARSYDDCLAAVRERLANGGKGWP